MGFLKDLLVKVEYKDIYMPYLVDDTMLEKEREYGTVSVEAYGQIEGQMKYCNACFELTLFDDSAFEEIVSTLHLAEGKKILVHLAYKKGRLKVFVIDVEYLAKITGNSKLLLLNPICWGINDKSCKDK